MVEENPTWGAPRIHGELLKLGFDILERTVSRYIKRRSSSGNQSKKLCAAFLRNHREVIVAINFFTVPTLTFRGLYCFFIIEHGRRKILYFNVTEHPTAPWIVQQLREAYSDSHPYQYAILDRDAKFGTDVIELLKASSIKPKQIKPRSSWNRNESGRRLSSQPESA